MKYLPMNPAVGGMPASDSMKISSKSSAAPGLRWYSPFRSSSSSPINALLPQHDDDGEGADGHECVGEQIVEQCPRCPISFHATMPSRDVAHVRNGRVGQQALDVVLRERGKFPHVSEAMATPPIT